MLRDFSHLSDPPADTEWVGFCMPKSHDLFSIKGDVSELPELRRIPFAERVGISLERCSATYAYPQCVLIQRTKLFSGAHQAALLQR